MLGAEQACFLAFVDSKASHPLTGFHHQFQDIIQSFNTFHSLARFHDSLIINFKLRPKSLLRCNR